MKQQPLSTAVVISKNTAALTPVQLIDAFQSLPQLYHNDDILMALEDSYQWCKQDNKARVLPYLQSAHLARKHGLEQQYRLNAQEIFKLLTRDMADKVGEVMSRRTRYRSSYYYHPEHLALSSAVFRIAAADRGYSWQFQLIQAFAKLIPLQALQAMEILEQVGMVPQAYWVADLVPVSVPPRLRDPILYAQVGRWFVSLAQWV